MSTAQTKSAETWSIEYSRQLSLIRRSMLLLMCCFAQFLDAFNNAALFPAIPTLENSIGITQTQSTWLIGAFQLTFASFLLISGRISDIYDPKNALVIGLTSLGILSTVAGFVKNEIVIIVLRALMGISSALTIPSAFSLLVHVFPEPREQARAISAFGGVGAVADVLGLFIGAILVQYVSYNWVFWSSAIIAITIALGSLFVIPAEVGRSKQKPGSYSAKWKRLDPMGISILTVSFILFMYGVTSGSTNGWATPGILVPLMISIVLMLAFFYWETLIPADDAAIPPHTWFYNNFSVLFGLALLPFFWWNAIFLVFTTLWQDVFHWTIISTAVHMFPLGVAALVMSFTGPLSRIFSPKWIILVGLSMVAVATILIVIGGSQPEDYWRYIFPAFSLGSAGTMLAYSHTNIAILQSAPTSMAGTVGAIFYGALQFGSAIGLAVFNSIETSVEARHGGLKEYHGRTAALWFLLGVVGVEILALAYFYQKETDLVGKPRSDDHGKGNASGVFELQSTIP